MKIKNEYSKVLFIGLMFLALIVPLTNAITDTSRPTVLSTMPENNALSVSPEQTINIRFSERMDPSTINSRTFTLIQQTTPDSESSTSSYRSRTIEGVITYEGQTATFTPLRNKNNPLQPNQEYGNVFTATISTGAKDLAGNSLTQDYKWSFTTGQLMFNTGSATTQLSQEVTPNSPTTSNPGTGSTTGGSTTTANVVNTPSSGTTSSNSFSWNWGTWVFLGLLALIVASIITSLVIATTRNKNKTVKDKTQKSKEVVNTSKKESFGDIYPVREIEGIGIKYAAALNKLGIMNTKQLSKADSVKTALLIDAPIISVKSWQNMARLASVNDIGPQYAELLERSGIHNVEQLKNYDSEELLEKINKKQESLKINIQGNNPGIITVENWIEQARGQSNNQKEGLTA